MKDSLPFDAEMRRRLLAFLVALALLLSFFLIHLFRMQIFGYEEAQEKVLRQVTVGAELGAPRGQILSSQGEVLAESRTVFRIWLSPVDIRSAAKATGQDVALDIAEGLSRILPLSKEELYQRAKRTGTLDQTLLRRATEEEAVATLRYAAENKYSRMIHVEAGTARSYPYSTLASHLLGFTGSDNQGLFGLEAQYEEALSGKNGQYIRAIDSTGKTLPLEYSSYLAAEPGLSLVTTLNVSIQKQLELQLEAAMENASAANRVCGAVMDVKTGAILAMATYPPYDCNDPYALDDLSLSTLSATGLSPGSQEYSQKKAELLYQMWNNKVISETYEPGSTFKIITAAMVLDSGAVTEGSRFSCPGYHIIGGRRISCHKKTGHGSGFSFSYGLRQSCNPTMIQATERLGAASFYQYFQKFGYLQKTGIDLPAEAKGIFHKEGALGTTELATSSFGQRFKTTVIAQLTAVCAVANGGRTITPYIAERLVDEKGNTVWQHQAKVGEQIISQKTATTVAEMLEEGVSVEGGARNAYAAGYRIAAKTGTSEKFDILDENGRSYLRIGSCVAFAPYDDPQVAAIIVVDEPSGPTVYGSMVAAPYISGLMGGILPILGHEPVYTEKELSGFYSVENYVGKKASALKGAGAAAGITLRIIGEGDTVLYQVPSPGTVLPKQGGAVLLYTERDTPQREVSVPDLLGKNADEANRLLVSAGLNIAFGGGSGFTVLQGAKVIGQSPPSGTAVSPGTVITVKVAFFDGTE